MSSAASDSYDEVPYETNTYRETHPDMMATLATLAGLRPPPVERCRVLEVGSADGGNLLGMALALPEARFVGIDQSRRQIESGRAQIEALGLANIELKTMSLLDVEESFGEFDYIIVHGVYSWVPPDVREKILAIGRRNLSADGVMYVSYNTFPGWHARGMVRELMLFHTQGVTDPPERVRKARSILGILNRVHPEPQNVYLNVMKNEATQYQGQTDSYILHEYLEEVNDPCYVHEFVERAAGHGLRYVAEGRVRSMLDHQAPTVRKTIEQLKEQYLDFLFNRTFRRTLLCHDRHALDREPTPRSVMALRAQAIQGLTLRKKGGAATEDATFTVPGEIPLVTNDPLTRVVLTTLIEAWPRSLQFDDLFSRTREALGRLPGLSPALAEPEREAVANIVLGCFRANIIELHTYEPPFRVEPGERPAASPLARRQAATKKGVTNFHHIVVNLTDFEHLVIRQLDGTRDRDAIVEALVRAVQAGEFTLQQDGRVLQEADAIRPILARSLDPCLKRLANTALLV